MRDVAGSLEGSSKRFNPTRTQGRELSSTQSQQFALLLHWSPNLRRSRKMNSRMQGNVLANELPAVRYFASREAEFPAARERHMALDLPETTSKIGGPQVRQFSVFLPNKVGPMLDIVKLLNTHSTHVVALSVSESTDSAIARMIVSDPERVEMLFRENEIAFGVCDLMVVELREVATQLIKLLAALLMAEVNVHFSYPLLTRPNGRAALAMYVDDAECATSVLLGEGFRLLSQTDISR